MVASDSAEVEKNDRGRRLERKETDRTDKANAEKPSRERGPWRHSNVIESAPPCTSAPRLFHFLFIVSCSAQRDETLSASQVHFCRFYLELIKTLPFNPSSRP